jgi:hypothetical protein
MRAATAVGATAILILVAEVWACAAGAEDAIKPAMRSGPEGMINAVFRRSSAEVPCTLHQLRHARYHPPVAKIYPRQ